MDHALAILLELAQASIQSGRPLYSSPLDEPLFFRKYFLPWIQEGMQERSQMTKLMSGATDPAAEMGRGAASHPSPFFSKGAL